MTKIVTHILIFSCIVIIFILNQCTSSKNQETKKNIKEKIEKITGKTVKIKPDSTFILHRNKTHSLSDYNLDNGNPKIVSRIYGDCHVCTHALQKWEKSKIIRKYDTLGVKTLFYIFSDSYKYFKKQMYPKITLSHPLIIDTTNAFLRDNSFIGAKKKYRTLLLDSNNKVILVGNPVRNEKLMKLYKKEINKRLN